MTKVVNPLWTAGYFVLIGLSAYFLGLPEQVAALALTLYLIAVTVYNPANGIIFLLLATPFFLGASTKPYYWLLELFIYLVIIIAFAKLWPYRRELRFRLVLPCLLIAISTLLSFPIDLKKFLLEVWANPLDHLFYTWAHEYASAQVYSFKVMANIFTGITIFYVTTSSFSYEKPEHLDKLFSAKIIIAMLVSIAGIVMFYFPAVITGEPWHYLGSSLVGTHSKSISAFSYNLQYLGQYLCLLTPFFIYFLINKDIKNRWIIALSLAVTVFALLQGSQKSVILTLIILALLVPIFYFKLNKFRPDLLKKYLMFSALAIFIVAAAVVTTKLGALSPKIISGASQFVNDPLYFHKNGIIEPRFYLWHTALKMFHGYPLFGIGAGKFHSMYFEFYDATLIPLKRVGGFTGSAHSLYLKLLAERGLVGIAAFSIFIFYLFAGAYKALYYSEPIRIKAIIATIMVTIAVWLLLGLTHDITHIRIIDIYFWIMCGLLVGTAENYMSDLWPLKLNRAAIISIIAILALAIVSRAYTAYTYPISPGYSTGFYRWEKQRDGTTARYMMKRAAMKVEVNGNTLLLRVASPIRDLPDNPHHLTIMYLNKTVEVEIKNPNIHDVIIELGENSPDHILMRFEVDRVFNSYKEGIDGTDRDFGVLIRLITSDNWR